MSLAKAATINEETNVPNGLLWVLPEIEQSLLSSMQDLKRFYNDIKDNIDNPIPLNKSLLYKSHHHIQLCDNLLQNKILVPNGYIHSIISNIEKMQDSSNIDFEVIPYIINSIQALIEYSNQVFASTNIDVLEEKVRYALRLYNPYYKLLLATGHDNIITPYDFINNTIDISFILEPNDNLFKNINDIYYGKYDIFLLKELKEIIINLKDCWTNFNNAVSYAKKAIVIIAIIEWREILPVMQTIENYLKSNQNNADLEVASALLFLEYIIQEPWREYEITRPKSLYNLDEICNALVKQINYPNEPSEININTIHQKVHSYAIKKVVLNQIDDLINEASIQITQKIDLDSLNKSLDIIEQIDNILHTIGFIDKNSLFKDLKNKFKDILSSQSINEQNISYINYVLSSLSQYIKNNYPDYEIYDNDDNFLEQDIENNENILEFFYIEKQNIIVNIVLSLKLWQDDDNEKDLLNLRGYFHALKGAFKTANFDINGKISGFIEQLINKYINKENSSKDFLICIVELAIAAFNTDEINNEFIQLEELYKQTMVIQNNLLSDCNSTFANNIELQQNLINIYKQESENILTNLEESLNNFKAKEITKILHTIEGSSSTANCAALKEWSNYIRQAINYYVENKETPSENINLLLKYAIYIAKDIISNLTLDNLSQELPQESITLLKQIIDEIFNVPEPITNENIESTDTFINTSNDNPDTELINLFLEEGQNLHTLIVENMANLYQKDSATKEILRALHTLKGGARMVGFTEIGEKYHNLEDLIEKNTSIDIIEKDLSAVVSIFEVLVQQQILTSNLSSNISNNSDNNDANLNFELEKSWFVKVDNEKLSEFIEKSYHIEGYISKIGTQIKDLIVQVKNTFPPLQKMNQLLNQITLQEHKRLQNTKASIDFDNINNQPALNANGMDSLEFDIFSILQIELNQSQNLNNSIIAQQEYIVEYLHQIAEQCQTLQQHTFELQQELSHLSLMSFSKIKPKLLQTCQQVAKEQKKNVELSIQGESIKVSKTILEAVSFAFEHLIRNSINHGIETKEERLQNNKSEVGHICINIQQQAEHMHITFKDDGQGINIEKIRAKAIKNGWITQKQTLDAQDLIQLILKPGFSTVNEVSQTAGRGIGLDTVVAYIKNIGGDIDISSEIGLGFLIKMSFPMRYFISDILVCKIGNYTFGSVMSNILDVKILSDENGDIDLQDQFELISMSKLLGQNHDVLNKRGIAINYKDKQYNIGIDEIISHNSMYIKKPSLLYENPGLIGISITNFYEVLPIYNLDLLLEHYFIQLENPNSEKTLDDSYKKITKHVMIVDDSATLRFTTQRILKKNNYIVTLAIDGIEALEKLQQIDTKIDLFLVDIEMPRMDGFELIENIRFNADYRDTPIIVISSRQIEKYQEQAYELGANDFLGKPYQTAQLMSHITRELTKAESIRRFQ